ncbi:MAG: sulfotransferase family protein [Gammaproteobacteria bacterium]
MRLPEIIIIGGQKCGSTSLHHYLDQHPDIAMSDYKELQFFSDDERWEKGVDWYTPNFSESAKYTGEASPQYAWQPFFPDSPERMYSLVPNAKLIYMVRDPIERVLSQYCDFLHQAWEERDFSGVLDSFSERPNMYVEVSRYFFQIEAYLKHYPREQLRVWTMEDLSADPINTVREVLDYIGVDNSFESPEWTRRRNPGERKRQPVALVRRLMKTGMRPEDWVANTFPGFLRKPLTELVLRSGSPIERPVLNNQQEALLMDIFRDDVRQLRAYSGKQFSNWRNY